MNLAKISMPCGNSVTGTYRPPKNMMAMLNTCTTAPIEATRSTSAVISSAYPSASRTVSASGTSASGPITQCGP